MVQKIFLDIILSLLKGYIKTVDTQMMRKQIV